MAEIVSSTHHQTIKNPEIEHNYSWFSSETGIYSSKHPKIDLPKTQFLDIVSHIFSYHKNGSSNSVLVDSSTGYSIPYSQLLPIVKSMACGLHQMGISKGDVVLIFLPNSIYFPIIFLGIVYLGAIVTPMNPLSSFSEAKKQTLSSRAKLAFTLPENAEKLSSLGLQIIQVPKNVIISEETQKFPDFSNLIFGKNHEKIQFLTPKINQDDTAAILYSSGTSGASKGVMLTHRNLIAAVELFVRFEASQYKENHEKNVYLAVMPMFHVYGLVLFGIGLISLGTNIVVMTKFDINEVVTVIDKFKVTHFPLVPPILGALTTKAKSLGGGVFEGASHLCTLKQVSCGAAPLTSQPLADFLHTFPSVDFIQGYGMTESTAVGTRGFNAQGKAHKYTSIGLLAPNTEAKVINCNAGLCMPPGKPGELLLRGPGIMKGYFNNIEATRLTIDEDGWLHTGDIAHFDNDGYLYVIDRLKDIIKYKGFQIAPADLETILMSHPDIHDAAVTGVADDKAGEIPVAFVVKKPGTLLSRNEVIKYVADMVSPHKKVREVVFVNSIPKSVAGKVLRRLLKNLIPTSKL